MSLIRVRDILRHASFSVTRKVSTAVMLISLVRAITLHLRRTDWEEHGYSKTTGAGSARRV